jgi:putative protease
MSVNFWQDQGVCRINLSREVSLEELVQIRNSTSAELEVFVHGAMCMSYSGRCLLSAFLNGRSANAGHCTQPCRWSYQLSESKRPGEYFPIQEDALGTYILNSRDLCLIQHLPILFSLGIDAFKVEGRMKGALYISSTVRAYRAAIDRCISAHGGFEPEPSWLDDLDSVSHRPYTSGFLFNARELPSLQAVSSSKPIQSHTLAGIVRPSPENYWEDLADPHNITYESTCLEVRSKLTIGMPLEFLYPDGSSFHCVIEHMETLNGCSLSFANPNTWVRMPVHFPTFPFQVIRTSAGCAGDKR